MAGFSKVLLTDEQMEVHSTLCVLIILYFSHVIYLFYNMRILLFVVYTKMYEVYHLIVNTLLLNTCMPLMTARGPLSP